LAAFAALASVSASASGLDIEQQIQRIRSGLLPPVLVKGEPVQLTGLSARMEALHVPGVSIAVIHNGKLEWARGFGVTRIGGPPVTPETLFQAASISKVVTTLAVLNLAQARKLDLDTDVNQYLKTWKLPTSELTRQAKVTLRGLLTHSAGITVHGFAGYEAGVPLPSVVQVLNGEPPANNSPIRVDMTPGLTWRYSGGGYVIAQQVLTDVTGVAFPKLMQDLVLRPLGMKTSSYEQPLSQDLLARAATPYRADGTAVLGGPHVYPELAAAALWTTPSDLARYAIAVQQAFSGKSERVLSAASAHAMLTPVYNRQGLGLVMGGSAAHKYFNHGGANEGYRCYLVAYEAEDGAVVMTNSDSGDLLIPEILRTIAHEYRWADFAPPERTLNTPGSCRAAGIHRAPGSGAVRFVQGRRACGRGHL
jgi:CubicO group peptidase (beta-lactamase class C family)